MAETEQPQIYLITPPEFSLSSFPDILSAALDVTDIACLRLGLSTSDEDSVMRAGDAIREIAHSRDIPLVIDRHVQMVERLGLDGVHLTDGSRGVRDARKDLGAEAIVGAFCANSRHDAMTAGEAGADYISFGPIAETSLGTGDVAEPELFAWWSEMIEIPVVAEGGLSALKISELAAITDFFGIGPEIWVTEVPAQTLATLVKALRS